MAFINFKDQWFQELRKVNWLVRECVEEKCRPFGITPEQGRVLNHLFLADGQVNLERAGHITMVKNDKDARFINVALTEKGRSLVLGMIEQMGSHSEKDTMSKEDLETILKGLKCLEKYLQS